MFRRRSRSPLRMLLFLVVVLVALGGLATWANGLFGLGGFSLPGGAGPLSVALPGSGGTATPSATPTPPPSWEDRARQTVVRYLDTWQRRDYQALYEMLSTAAKGRITQERFVGRHQAIMSGVVITKVGGTVGAVQLLPVGADPTTASVGLTVTMESGRVGRIEEQKTLGLVREGGEWRVDWTPDLIFNGLTNENLVRVYPDDPQRGPILDRKGRLLAGPGTTVTVGVVPGNIKDEPRVVQALSAFLGMPADAIRAKFAGVQPDWWLPLKDLPESRRADAEAKLANLAGVEVRSKTTRVYPYGQLAAHVLGYVSHPTAEDLAKFADRGYEEEDFVGREGIEAWAERDLAGQKGGRVFIVDQAGNEVRVIGERRAQPGRPVQLTIDVDIQQEAEKALGEKTGSIVVLDPRDNSVLALASRPAFDPNAFILGISAADWQKLAGDPRHPFQNRATLSAYPTGSIFKVITMAAGLEKGGFTPQSEFQCNGRWTGLPGLEMGDWRPEGHGRLDLEQGLVESCDIVFYELGKTLDSLGETLLPDFARQFGLGEPTGLVGLPEAAGTVPDAAWKQSTQGQPWYAGDAVNLAIGQGFLEATPLQMANVYATLANGGELRTPLLVRRVGEGAEAKEYKSEARRRIPVSAANITAIREAMKQVASSPAGTAYYAFRGFGVPTAAKTGSAENQNPKAHAWFAGFAPADNPELVILVMVEGGEAGGEVAAPLARQVLEAYFGRR